MAGVAVVHAGLSEKHSAAFLEKIAQAMKIRTAAAAVAAA
jgi:hypothetical protein